MILKSIGWQKRDEQWRNGELRCTSFREERDSFMDLAYWGFRHWPFDRTFAANRFFASPLHEEALSRLLFLVEESRRCGIIVGPDGTGKTFLLKLVGQRAERLGRLVVRCEAAGLKCDEFIAHVAIACHVGCDPNAVSSKIGNGLRARFAALALIRQPLVLLIDHFGPAETGSLKVVQRLHQLADMVGLTLTIAMALSGGTIPNMMQDFVELRIDLAAWTAQETSQFIHTAIEHAGCKKRLFTDEAIDAIQEITKGVPAKIVSLANLSLLTAQGQEETVVTREFVEAAVIEFFPCTENAPSRKRPPSPVSAAKRNAKSFAG